MQRKISPSLIRDCGHIARRCRYNIAASREIADQDFTLLAMGRRMAELYSEAMTASAQPACR